MSDNEQSEQIVQQVEIKKASKKISKKKSEVKKTKVEPVQSGPIDNEEALLQMDDDELEEQIRRLENETGAIESVNKLEEEEVDAKLKKLSANTKKLQNEE